ncbi:MAG: SOS response-associated peptidase [Candidatus Krumholzibacteriia bacterium]
MCGRIVLKTAPGELAAEFALAVEPPLAPRYNIAPTQPVAAIRRLAGGERACDLLSWGLVPRWSTDPRVGAKMFNARSETVGEKPSFREALARRRCLVAASGFYEWRRRGGSSEPHYFSAADGGLLALAGLWERWEYPGGEVLESCSVLTCPANRLMRRVHHRMPVILPAAAYDRWLGADPAAAVTLTDLLQPAPDDRLRAWPVAPLVNRVANDGPELIAPAHDQPPGQLNLF